MDYVFLHGIGTTSRFWMLDMLKGIKTCIKRFYHHIVHPILLRMRFKFLLHLNPNCLSIENSKEILDVTNEKLKVLSVF